MDCKFRNGMNKHKMDSVEEQDLGVVGFYGGSGGGGGWEGEGRGGGWAVGMNSELSEKKMI